MKEIHVLIIEDNLLLREVIKAMIEEQPDLKVETPDGKGQNILKIISDYKPDVLLMDAGLQELGYNDILISLKGSFPEIKIIMMGLVPTQEEVLQFIENGISGFLLKNSTLEDFIGTIRSVADGEKVLPSAMTKSLFSVISDQGNRQYGASKLIESVRMTRREREVVALIGNGFTNKEIAEKLHLSAYTVKSHVHNILEKMGLNTRIKIAIYAKSIEDSIKNVYKFDSAYQYKHPRSIADSRELPLPSFGVGEAISL